MFSSLSKDQYDQLLSALPASRVAKRKQAGLDLSYLEAWDVRAHLIRIFGFGGWSATVESADLVFEESVGNKWNVAYKVLLRLTIHDLGCYYTEAAIGSATLPQRGEAHDMAVKTAESDALKRAAVNLGTQFGLSLYDNGNRNDVVVRTLVPPCPHHDYVSIDDALDDDWYHVWDQEISDAVDQDRLRAIWVEASQQELLDKPIPFMEGDEHTTLRELIVARNEQMANNDE